MDVEKLAGAPRYLAGFPSLTAFIATDRDHTSAIFKRFKRLGARNLLHLQSRLAALQVDLDVFDREEEHGGLDAKQYSRNWESFSAVAETDPRQKQKKALLDEIGRTLADYREALIYESQLASLPPPTKRTLEAFRYHFFNQDSGSPFPTLGGSSATLFEDQDDLVALREEDRDRLTAVIQDHCSSFFKIGRPQGDIIYASDRRIARFVTVISTINAAALLVGAIVSLYAIKSPKTRLGIIALFTALFAGNVGILTNARRTELFAATAA
ncbi:hypothetical protein FB567DRAFT_619589 [Paraphoma chrysanthemicola]|uniref:DUF6594 domain-containing protein n=1 Tax=Paraphoma chrysanthemicola TaxID=798071 RepID=A0A8K0VZH3_9PLEO|nr:hypothetical protein FB567DRAFT_619589 [Paraphoma chrysanthemicola]